MIEGNLYRGVRVPPTWAKTSANPGQGCISKLQQASITASFADVMAYQNDDVVQRIAEELGCGINRAREIFDDVKRFLYMAALKSGEIGETIPTPVIDEGWHAFILFTDDYAQFCERYFGTFLHHLPHRVSEPKQPREALLPTIDAMFAVFGGVPSDNWHYDRIPA